MSTESSPPFRVVLLSNQRSLFLTEAAPDPGDSIFDVDLGGKEESQQWPQLGQNLCLNL